MEIRFLGGASQVGSLGMVVREGSHKVLFDYGMTPTDPPQYPLALPPGLEWTFLTHAHLDHSGMTPLIVRQTGHRLVTTSLTESIAELLLLDALKVARSEGYPEPFEAREVRHLLSRAVGLGPQDVFRNRDLEVQLTPAGHIPGATMFLYRGEQDVLFTGDVRTLPSRLVAEARPLPADVLVMESTYAGREHPDRQETERRFLDQVEAVVSQGGKVLVPAFAVGRSQEVLLALAKTDLEVWVDGMARAVNEAYESSPEYLRDPVAFRRTLHRVHVVEGAWQRKKALQEADVVVTTGGMMDGGPVLWYLDRLYRDTRNAIYLTGYQVEGSNGRQLIEKGYIEVEGETLRPSCDVAIFDFSAHAGHSELIDLARKVDPRVVVLMHGDQRELLAQDLEKEFQVLLPENGETLTL